MTDTHQTLQNILSGTSVDDGISELLAEARKRKNKPRVQNAKRVMPGGPPILADLVALIMSRGKRGVTVDEVASTFNAADRTTRKWRAQLKHLKHADYHESTDPDSKLRMYLWPVYDA